MKCFYLNIILILLFAFVSSLSMAQDKKPEQDKFSIWGDVRDANTKENLVGATVQMLSADSTVLGSNVIQGRYYYISIPRRAGKYIVRASFMGYRTAYVNVSIDKIGRREFSKQLPPIFMREDSKMLQGVNVVASKVKFYNKGDTVVYNADAFVLSEGSMLDALVKQLPGVEIRDDGKIYHNGKFVESLLLNGRDFFKGNKQVMLENLPSYTVNQVKVYEKQGKISEFLGQKLQNDRQYVIDVNLKKEYNAGTLANIEAGGGTSDRYLGRLFALRYSDAGHIGVYGNINNLNDKRKPGENSNWTPDKMPKGESRELQAGIDYSVKTRKVSLRGEFNMARQRQDLVTNVDRVNFLSQGDTYDYERTDNGMKNFSFSTQHSLDVDFTKFFVFLQPNFNYSKFDNTSNSISGTFSRMQQNVSRELLENIYTSTGSEALRKDIVNRYKKEGLGSGHQLGGGLKLWSIIKIAGSDDHISLIAEVNGNSRKDELFNKYGILYGETGTKGRAGNQYFDNQPDRNWNYMAKIGYQYKMSRYNILNFDYRLNHVYKKKNSSLYLLDRLEDFDGGLGVLPSMSEYESVIDLSNSYKSTSYETNHSIELGYELRGKPTANGKWEGGVTVKLQPMRNKLDYLRGNTDTTLVKNDFFLPVRVGFNWTSKEHATYGFSAETSYQMPDLKNMVDIKDDTDPLNIRIGNRGLKGQTTYSLFLYTNKNNGKTGVNKMLTLDYKYFRNAFAMGYSYDDVTGARTYRAENVNGNWTGTARLTYNTPLDKKRKLTLNTQTRAELRNSVDLAGRSTAGLYETVSSSVHTFLIGENLNLNYKIGSSSTVGLKLNGTWRDVDSRREDFTGISAWDINYGMTGIFKLPWNLQFSTDLTMYTRRGYEGSTMNTDDLVWNARLSFSMLKGKLTWMLDGFDILNQLNNVTRVINAQGRTETFTNALPRYALLHVAYKFNMKPKKR